MGKPFCGTPISLDWSGLGQTVDGDTVVKEAWRLMISGDSLYAMFRNHEDDTQPVISVPVSAALRCDILIEVAENAHMFPSRHRVAGPMQLWNGAGASCAFPVDNA